MDLIDCIKMIRTICSTRRLLYKISECGRQSSLHVLNRRPFGISVSEYSSLRDDDAWRREVAALNWCFASSRKIDEPTHICNLG